MLGLRGDVDLLRVVEAGLAGGGRMGTEDGNPRRGNGPSLLGAGCSLRERPRLLVVGTSISSGSLIFLFPALAAASFEFGIVLGGLRLRGRELEVITRRVSRGANEGGFVL